jgi:uncharacterized protein YdbL (DUF1318 family)
VIEPVEFEHAVTEAASRRRGAPASALTVSAARAHFVCGLTIGKAAKQSGLSRQRVESYVNTLQKVLETTELVRPVKKKLTDDFRVSQLAKKAGMSEGTLRTLIGNGLLEAKEIKRRERSIHLIPHEVAYRLIASRAIANAGNVRKRKYPTLSAAEFAATLEALYLAGAVRSDGWLFAAWLIFVESFGLVEAANTALIPKGSLTRPAKIFVQAYDKLNQSNLESYEQVFSPISDFELVVKTVKQRWLLVRKGRIDQTVGKRHLKSLATVGERLVGYL